MGGVIATLGLAAVLTVSVVAAAPNVNTGSGITVDGSFADWTEADFFADMYRAGKADKEVESKLYLRYDCTSGILYVRVDPVDGVTIIESDDDNFVKFGQNDKKVDGNDAPPDATQPNFAYAPENGGWEASFSVGQVSILDLNVHAQVDDDGSQTSAVADRAIPMNITCPVLTPTLTLDKVTVGGDSSFAFTATGGFNQSLTGAGTPLLVSSTAGVFTITETVSPVQTAAGWSFTSVDCTGNAVAETPSGSSVTVTVGADEDVICTFTNTLVALTTQSPSLTLDKVVTAGNAALGFNFTLDSAAIAALSANDAPRVISTAAGAHTIVELAQSGWTLASIQCRDNAAPAALLPTTAVTNGVTVTVGADQDVTCTFTNTPQGGGTAGGNPTPTPRSGTQGGSVPNTAMEGGPVDQAPVALLALLAVGSLGYVAQRNIVAMRNRR